MAKVNKSRIVGKIKKRSKGAWKKSRSKQASARGQQLPGGIVRGVAQFSSYNIDENDNKVPFISLTGIVKEPEEYRGARATVTHRFEETERESIEDKMDKFSSDLQLLGCDTEGTTEDDWDGLLAELVKDKPHFYFNTREWEFTGRDGSTVKGTTVFIQGLAEDWDDDDEVPNDDEPEDDEDGEDNEPDDEPEDDDDDSADDDGDDSEDDSDEDGDDDGNDDDEGDDDWVPEKGDIYLHQVNSRAKAREVEVQSVNKSEETVNVKRVDDGKVFKDVPWDKLQGAD